MGKVLTILFLFFASACFAQETWYGEIALSAGGGANDIYNLKTSNTGGPSYSGNGFCTTGLRIRRIVTDWFSVEGGAVFSEQFYTQSPAPGISGNQAKAHFSTIAVPVIARFDFLKYIFTDAGIISGTHLSSPEGIGLSGVGVTAGLGVCYRFKSDIIITARAFTNQYALVHFTPGNEQNSLSETGMTIGVGYRFIRLGKCHCPGAYNTRRKFF